MSEEKAEYVTESTELLPCPFCESEAVIDVTVCDTEIRCDGHCGARITCDNHQNQKAAQSELVGLWNTRPEPEAPESAGGEWPKIEISNTGYEFCVITASDGHQEIVWPDNTALVELVKAKALSTPQQAAPIEAEEQVGNALLSAKGLIETLYSFVPYDAKMGPAISITVKELNNAMDALSALHSRSGMVSISRECADEARELFLFEALTEEEKAFNFTEGSDSYKKHMRRAAYPKAYADHIKQSLEQSNGR